MNPNAASPNSNTVSSGRSALVVAAWLFTEFLGYAALVLILYSLISSRVGEAWRPVERWATFVSSLLTLLGTFVTAASVYFGSYVVNPRKHSKFFVAPVVIISSLVAVFFLLIQGSLSQTLVNAFGLLAIAGALKRLLPYP
jgi:hypothetical protein